MMFWWTKKKKSKQSIDQTDRVETTASTIKSELAELKTNMGRYVNEEYRVMLASVSPDIADAVFEIEDILKSELKNLESVCNIIAYQMSAGIHGETVFSIRAGRDDPNHIYSNDIFAYVYKDTSGTVVRYVSNDDMLCDKKLDMLQEHLNNLTNQLKQTTASDIRKDIHNIMMDVVEDVKKFYSL